MPPIAAAAIAHPFIAAAVAGSVAMTGASISQSSQQAKAAKSASAAADAQAQKNAAALKEAQDTASSQASAALNQRRARMTSSQTIFTSPLGIGGTASVARKTLLGQ